MGGLIEKFGKERVRNTVRSISDRAGFVVGSCMAMRDAAMVGMRPVVDMLIAPFVYVAFDQSGPIGAVVGRRGPARGPRYGTSSLARSRSSVLRIFTPLAPSTVGKA